MNKIAYGDGSVAKEGGGNYINCFSYKNLYFISLKCSGTAPSIKGF